MDPETPCFLDPPTPKDKLLRAELVLRSVTTGESSVLYVFFGVLIARKLRILSAHLWGLVGALVGGFGGRLWWAFLVGLISPNPLL